MTLGAGSPQAAAGQLIASAILAKDTPDQPLTGNADSADQTILSGYAAGGYLSTSPQPADRATLAVVIIPATPPSTSDANRGQPDPGDAGPAAEPGGQRHRGGRPGDRLRRGQRDRRDAGRRPRRPLSSVDNADTPNGQIVVAQALYEQLAEGKSGSYGSLPGATQPGPARPRSRPRPRLPR